MLILLKRILNLGWKNVSRNAGLSVVAIFVIVINIILITFIFTVRDFGEAIIEDVKDKISISVYFKEGVDEETILEAKENILALEDTRSVEYTSKDEAFDIFIERYKDNPVIMASLAEVGNPFLPSLSIRAETVEGYEVIANYLTESPLRIFFEKIDYDQRRLIIEEVFEITFLAQRVGLILAIFLTLIAVLVVFNTVRLAIYGMKEEIKIMRLVGVSNQFIQGLFVMQGAIIGFIAFLISFMLVFGLGLFFGENIRSLIPNLDIYAYLKENFLFIFFMQLLVGVGLGKISSIFATAKYLKD